MIAGNLDIFRRADGNALPVAHDIRRWLDLLREQRVDTKVLVKIDEGDADADRLAELSEDLRAELLGLDVQDVTLVRAGQSPPDSRGTDLATAGLLLVLIKDSMDLVGHMITVLRSWLGRSTTSRTVELTVGDRTLRLTNASSDQQDRLVEEFVRAIAGK
jgi:hypothetical protein